MTIKSTTPETSGCLVNSTTANTLVNYLAQKGLSKAALEEALAFDLETLNGPDTTMPLSLYCRLWDIAIDHTGDHLLGLRLAQNPNNIEMSLVSHVFFNSQNLKEGLKHYIRYYALINESVSVQLSIKDNKAMVSYLCNDPSHYCVQDVEHSLALSVMRIKDYLSGDISLDEVHFQHPCHSLKAFEKFFGCPVYFNQKTSALVFKSKYLDYVFPQKSTNLFNFLTGHLEPLLKKIKKKTTLSDQVTRLIHKSLSEGKYDAENISSELHMSRHTLYRKLKSEGVSFHELVDNVRKNKALELIQKKQHTLSEIAFLLGFSELSSFSRAFKKWTGSSPNNYSKP